MNEFEPAQSREEAILQNMLGAANELEPPQSRVEKILQNMLGATYVLEPPQSRIEKLLMRILEEGGPGGGGEITRERLDVAANGTYTAPSGKAYTPVVVAVPNTYAAADEGKVVSNGALVAQTAHAEVTQNGTIDTTLNNSVVVNVPQGSTPTGTKQISITENGTTTEDVAAYANAEITVNVPSGGGDYVAVDWLDPTKPTGNIIFNGTFINVNKGSYLLIGRSGIGNVHFTNSTILPASSFQNSSVARFVGEKILHIGGQAFYNSSISEIDVQGIDNYASVFAGCGSLQTIILRGTSVTAIAANAFNASRFSNGGSGGTIYIPKALYDHLGDGTALDYKAATNWSTVDGYGTITWAQIEGSQYENYYVDGTPIPTT